jgi:tetratricopeptide (TPR) repeat protein
MDFKAIADLFQPPAEVDLAEVKGKVRKKKGDTADESDELGALSLSDGDYETAIRHFKEAVAQREPGDITSHINLAGAYDVTDQYPAAYRQYEKALRLKQDASEPLVGISDLMRRYGRFRDAAQELERAIEAEPDNAHYRLKLAELFREMGERKRALTAAQFAVAAQPDDSFYHYWIGDLLIEMGRDEEALESLRAAIELSPGDDFLYLRVAVPFWRLGRHQETIKALRLASDLDPEKNVYHGLLEYLLQEMGQEDDADQESARARKMDRYDRDILERTLREMRLEI